jgi:pimeloyl-ACP methyl ester carboxylesterase
LPISKEVIQVKRIFTRRRWFACACALPAGLRQLAFGNQETPFPQSESEPSAPNGLNRFKRAQNRVLARYALRAQSRFVGLREPALRAHVLAAGRGHPVVLIHGGGSAAVNFVPLISRLAGAFRCFAPDRPGCGLTDPFDYTNVPFRRHGTEFIRSVLDALNLPQASILGNSIGGYWAISFALAAPERVSKLVLLGEPAGSSPPPPPRVPPRKPPGGDPSIEAVRARYRVLMANPTRAPAEIIEADYAASRLPGASLAWNTMLDQLTRTHASLTYALRPELRNLKPPALFIWGDKDVQGPPSLGEEMAELAPNARCEVLPETGHLPWLDQPDRCTKLVLDFLGSV